jgi:hypothetical protein
MHVIYKKVDRSIVGSVFPRRDQKATNIALSVELENILASELGGKAEDYSYIEIDEINRKDLVLEIDENMSVVFKPSQKSMDRDRAIDKLKKLGLTESEIKAIT